MKFYGHVVSVRLVDLKLWSPGDQLMFNNLAVPARRSYGHRFKIQITIEFRLRRPPDTSDRPDTESGCQLLWYEHSTKAYPKLPAHEWRNIFGESAFDPRDPTSWQADNPIWDPWSEAVHDVTEEGRKVITIADDTPSMPLTEDGYAEERKRILHFCVAAKCSDGCPQCAVRYQYVAAVQGLSVRHTVEDSKRVFGLTNQVSFDGASPQGFDNGPWLDRFKDGVNWSRDSRISEIMGKRTGFHCGVEARLGDK